VSDTAAQKENLKEELQLFVASNTMLDFSEVP
jgi:hypothetical protein